MGVAKVKKVLIAFSKKYKEKIFSILQKEGVLHIEKMNVASPEEEHKTPITEAYNYLKAYEDKKGFKLQKPVISIEDLYNRVKKLDFRAFSKEVNSKIERLKSLNAEEKSLLERRQHILPFKTLSLSFDNISYKYIVASLGEEHYKKIKDRYNNKPVVIELINTIEKNKYFVAIGNDSIIHEISEEVKNFGNTYSIDKNIPVALEIKSIDNRLKEIEKETYDIEKQLKVASKRLKELEIALDYLEVERVKKQTMEMILSTDTTGIIFGWIKEIDTEKLDRSLSDINGVYIEYKTPEKKDNPPVALNNRKIFKPFEMILNLYGTPMPEEIDPTPLLTPFFVIFFGLCLTDAGYGVLMTLSLVLVLFLLKRKDAIIYVLLLGSIATIFAGAITGGWFGDMPDRLGFGWFRKEFILFDPMTNPMPFFYLSLAIGYIQMLFGILVEVYDSLRHKNFATAIFENLTWFVLLFLIPVYAIWGEKLSTSSRLLIILLMLVSVVTIFTLSNRESDSPLWVSVTVWLFFTFFMIALTNNMWHIPDIVVRIVLSVIPLFFIVSGFITSENKKTLLITGLIGMGIIILWNINILPIGLLFLAFILPLSAFKGWIGRLSWGLYNLYGATSYLGVVLSYIRLMALGMVTGGIALAINTIAWKVLAVPYVGIILAFIILVIGHLYNIAISALGAFVHTLRLQYVEFFPRFFTGGGRRFVPFRINTKYFDIRR